MSWSIYHHKLDMERLFQDAEARGSDPTVRKNFISTDVPHIIDTAHLLSLPKCRDSFLFASRRQRILKEVVMATLSVHTSVLWACHGGDKFQDIPQKFSLASTASRSAPEVSETPSSSC